MFQHHALGPPCGTRRVDHVGQIPRINRHVQRVVRHFRDLRPVRIQSQHVATKLGQAGQQLLPGDQQVDAGVLQHVAQPLRRVGRIQRQVGTARLEDGQRSHHGLHRTFQGNADHFLGANTALPQVATEAVGSRLQLGVGYLALARHNSQPVRLSLRPGRKPILHRNELPDLLVARP